PQRAAQLREDRVPCDQLVFEQNDLEEVRAQSPRRERAHEHVRIEENPQEMASKTSSSVSRPCASAKGSVLPRSSRKRATATSRASASRASSLLVRPVVRARRSSALSSLSSSRIVRVAMVSRVRQCLTNVPPRLLRRHPDRAVQPDNFAVQHHVADD